MPTYEYECRHCGYNFERFQNISEKPIGECPKCGKNVKRLIGAGSGIIFKGSGFYATDYRKSTKSRPDTCPKAKDGCNACPHSKTTKGE